MATSESQIQVLQVLFAFLKSCDYHATACIPLRKYRLDPKLIFNEINNVFRYTARRQNLFAISMVPNVYRALSARKLNALRDIFFLNIPASLQDLEQLLGDDLLRVMVSNALFDDIAGNFKFIYRVVPHHEKLLLTSRFDRNVEDFTFLSFDSIYLSNFLKQWLKRCGQKFKSGLDLGCGMGIQAFTVCDYCASVVGIDINMNAIEYAQLNAAMLGLHQCNFLNLDFCDYELGGYDLVVANPPFVYYAQPQSGPADSDGGEMYGLEVTKEIISRLPAVLNQGGRAFVLTRSPLIGAEDYLLSRLPKWLGRSLGCTYHYVADSVVWLKDYERLEGIRGYRHVILEIAWYQPFKVNKSSYWKRRTNLF